VKITFLCPHLRIAGGVRAILTYADLLTADGHHVTVVVPAKGRGRAFWRSVTGAGPDWIPGFRARVVWVDRWRADALPDGNVILATAWQSATAVAEAPARCGRKFYFVQHYESLYHGQGETVDATYRLPLKKIVISTWLRDIMRERFASEAAILVTPVDPMLFHAVSVTIATSRPRVLMLHHDYAWKGTAEGFGFLPVLSLRVLPDPSGQVPQVAQLLRKLAPSTLRQASDGSAMLFSGPATAQIGISEQDPLYRLPVRKVLGGMYVQIGTIDEQAGVTIHDYLA